MKKAIPLFVVATMLTACSDTNNVHHVHYEMDGNKYEYDMPYPDGVDKSTVERYAYMLMTENNDAIVTLMDSIIASGTPIDLWCSDYYNAMKKSMPYDSILPRLLQIKEHEPSNPIVFSTIGYTYSHLGDLANALEHFRRGLNIAPDNSNMWYGLGIVTLQHGDTLYAINSFKQSIELATQQNLESQIALSQHMLDKLKDKSNTLK